MFRHFDGRIITSMKTSLQLSIDIDLKNRLKNLSSQSEIPMAKIVQKFLEEHLDSEERKHNVQLPLKGTTQPTPLHARKRL